MRPLENAIVLDVSWFWAALNKQVRPLMSTFIMAAIMLAASIGLCGSLASAEPVDLYSATVIVTGRNDLVERTRGIREALPMVLTKLTADATIGQRAFELGLQDKAAALVRDLHYRDRKEGIQISDEQGTRDRSFELTVNFDTLGIDDLVAQLGAKPWRGERPAIVLALIVDDGVDRFLLTEMSEKGYGQRLAMFDAARALALPVSLPKRAGGQNGAEAEQAAVLSASPVSLAGLMTITPAGYWNTEWRLKAPEGIAEVFATKDTTFDIAIEEALRRSARSLAKQ